LDCGVSNAKAAFKALTTEQQAIVTGHRVAGELSPDDWLRLLGPVGEFDRQAEAARKDGGFFERRFARKHDVPDALRSFVLPLLPILREDQAPGRPLELRIDLTGAQQPSKRVRAGDPYRKGAYLKVVDTFYDDPWLEGHAHFADGVDVRFSVVDHLRSSEKTKKSASGRTKRKTKRKKKTELSVTLSAPARNYAVAGGAVRDVPKESVKAGEHRTVVKLSGVVEQPSLETAPVVGMLLELISGAYERVEPSRRKKL
jgi:hypothetical protein